MGIDTSDMDDIENYTPASPKRKLSPKEALNKSSISCLIKPNAKF